MKKTFFLFKIFVIYILLISNGLGISSNYFDKGKILFEKKDFDNSKIFFEREIVFNPKNEKPYLYLAKIFNKQNNDQEEEINLKNVLLLDPNNDEAIYMLIMLNIKHSDYELTKTLINKFNLVCKDFCSKKPEILEKFNKLIPDNEKD